MMKNKFLLTLFCTFSAVFLLIFCNFIVQKIVFTPINKESKVTFRIRNLGVMVDGSFDSLAGTINFNPADLANSNIDVFVPINKINTGIGARDKHLQAEEYFNAEKYPFIRIKSKTITIPSTGNGVMDGTLSIKGVEKPITINFTYIPENSGYRFNGGFTVKRRLFKVGSKRKKVMKDDVEVKLNVFIK